ncbi:hypothetical protein HDU92_004223 [Lobulomyces angularis]|nr:hypothetical protein HDU92_004223 [Lobulomyces angularis]
MSKSEFTLVTRLDQQDEQEIKKKKILETKLLRKLDLRLLPILMLCYVCYKIEILNILNRFLLNLKILSFLDRSNIAQARIANASTNHHLAASLKLTDFEVMFSISIFFVGYIAFEVPSNLMIKRFTPSRWISRIMVTWGITCVALGFIQNYAGLLICRLLLGIFESGFVPGVIFFLTFWYKKSEISVRIGWFFTSLTVAGIIGSLCAYGITANMNMVLNFEGWRWIFILEGVPSIIVGIFLWFYLPDYPETSKFLTIPERELLIERLKIDAANNLKDPHFDKVSFFLVLKDPTTYMYSVAYLCLACPMYSFNFTFPTILFQLGFSDLMAQLLSTPPFFMALVAILVVSYLSDKYQNRVLPLLLVAIVSITGFLGMVLAPTPKIKYIFGIITAIGVFAPCAPFLAWVISSHTSKGSTGSAVLIATVISSANFGGLLNSFLYPLYHSPNFVFGHLFNIGLLVLFIILVSTTDWINRRRRTKEFSAS